MKRIFLKLITFVILSSNVFSQKIKEPVFFTKDQTWADSILTNLSYEEKIAQLFMVIAYSNKSENHKKEITRLVKKHKIGGLMFLQGGPERQAILTNYYQSVSKIPLMIF